MWNILEELNMPEIPIVVNIFPAQCAGRRLFLSFSCIAKEFLTLTRSSRFSLLISETTPCLPFNRFWNVGSGWVEPGWERGPRWGNDARKDASTGWVDSGARARWIDTSARASWTTSTRGIVTTSAWAAGTRWVRDTRTRGYDSGGIDSTA